MLIVKNKTFFNVSDLGVALSLTQPAIDYRVETGVIEAPKHLVKKQNGGDSRRRYYTEKEFNSIVQSQTDLKRWQDRFADSWNDLNPTKPQKTKRIKKGGDNGN